MQKFKVITGDRAIEAMKLLSDKTRRQILHLLRDKAMTTTDIADALGLTEQNVRYHLAKMESIDLVEVTGQKPSERPHVLENYWRATSENIYISIGENSDIIDPSKQDPIRIIKKVLSELPNQNNNSVDVVKIFEKYGIIQKVLEKGSKIAEKIINKHIEDIDPITKSTIISLMNKVFLDEEDFQLIKSLEEEIIEELRSFFKPKIILSSQTPKY